MVNTITTASLTEKAMLVSLNIGAWTARKYDDNATRTVDKEYGTNGNAGRYNKMLLAKEALAEIQQLDGRIRAYHYEVTLPWSDNNQRVILNRGYADYTDQMREFKTERGKLITAMVASYSTYVSEAMVRLGRLFKSTDYPNENEIERKFYFDFSIMPIPSSDDFRVALQSGEIDRIRQDIENRIHQNVKNAMLDLFGRLKESVSHMVTKLSDKDAKFRRSLVDNLCRMTEVLGELDLVDDPEFSKIKDDIESKLCIYDPAELRENQSARKQAAKDAAVVLTDIESAMSAYMG